MSLPTKVDFYIKEGDRDPALVANLVDENEEIIDLTAAVAVKFFMIKPPGTTPKVNGSAAVVVGDPEDGTVRYAWASGDTDTPGDYNAEFEVEWSDGTKTTFPNFRFINVRIMKSIEATD